MRDDRSQQLGQPHRRLRHPQAEPHARARHPGDALRGPSRTCRGRGSLPQPPGPDLLAASEADPGAERRDAAVDPEPAPPKSCALPQCGSGRSPSRRPPPPEPASDGAVRGKAHALQRWRSRHPGCNPPSGVAATHRWDRPG